MNTATQTDKKKTYVRPAFESYTVDIHPVLHSEDWAGAKQRPTMSDEEDDYGDYDGEDQSQPDDYWK